MKIREMTASDIKAVLPLYISYYNEQENGCWTEELAAKRIHQVLNMEGSFSLIDTCEPQCENQLFRASALSFFVPVLVESVLAGAVPSDASSSPESYLLS